MSSGDTPMSTGQQLSESFEPAAAADAINAVLRAPSGSASSGLEMQPGVELDTKDVEMEEVKMDEGGLQTKSDLPSPKSSEPDWELADPVPDTAAELVGDLLMSQEEDDRQQFVFLSEWGQEEKEKTMGQVKVQLDELTQHIQELSVGSASGDDHGPQPDEPPMVAVEPAGDGLFKLTCFPEPFPHVSRTVSSLLTGLKVKEVAQLFDLFQGKTLTRAGVERALECYVVTKRSKDHENLLRRSYNKGWTRRRLVNRWNGSALNAWSLDLRPRSLASCASPRIPLFTARSLQPAWWWTGWSGRSDLTTKAPIIGKHLASRRRRRRKPPLT